MCMQDRVEKIHVENFKSLKDFDIELKQFNVLIGRNGSGKTNVLELFKFMNLCINPIKSPSHPFADWWGFGNIVWSRRESLPISFSIKYSVCDIPVDYTAIISGTGGKLSFLTESCIVENLMRIKRDLNAFELVHDETFLEKNTDTLQSMPKPFQKTIDDLHSPSSHAILPNRSTVQLLSRLPVLDSASDSLCLGHFYTFEPATDGEEIPFVSPIIFQDDRMMPLFRSILRFLTTTNHVLFLRQLNYNMIRQPSPMNKNISLSDDGDGLTNLLYTWYDRNNNQLPDRITLALEELFPDWQITFTTTEDGRIVLNVLDGDLLLSPTSIPDGFYKLLAILAAVHLRPKILLIDEVDTSLHSEIIEYVISTLKTSESTIIVTTHSPVVVDLVDLEDLILLERTGHETRSHRIMNPDETRLKLNKIGITTSESWVYGELR